MNKLMYHLRPNDPEERGDLFLFLDENENLEDNLDYKDFKSDGWVFKGVFRLTLISGTEILPGYLESS